MIEKSIIEHLDDLRSCILKSLAGIAVGFLVALVFISSIFRLFSRPYTDFLIARGIPSDGVLKSLGPADTLHMTFTAALMFGLGLALPWIAYQIWLFVAPALYKHEQKHVAVFCLTAAAFFLAGVVFAYFLVLPAALSFFYEYTTSLGVAPAWAITNYMGFVVTFLTGFGIVFELPVAVLVLSWLGIVTPAMLVTYRKHAIVAIFIIAGVVTPGPDMASQLMMGVPMLILYELAILAARVVERGRSSSQLTNDPSNI